MTVDQTGVQPSPNGQPYAAGESSFGPLLAFLILSYALSWAWLIPLTATGHTVLQGSGWPTHFPSLIAPMLAAFIVTAYTTGYSGVCDLLGRMGRWRIGWRWWLAALSPLGFFGIALGVIAASGGSMPTRHAFTQYSGLPSGLGVVGVALTVLVIDGFGEETGWRGYALPHSSVVSPRWLQR